jgi:hypothetical protein
VDGVLAWEVKHCDDHADRDIWIDIGGLGEERDIAEVVSWFRGR